ncbi:hypothetical protein DL766_002215 [Monosporascus sp. MC13-8B]|uniref:Impact N-terminal domain-containing protein n=1 Tax=Monosporascus cannonballus TaxID=155416 RepID=A0ABY0GQP1_9PEZI|nr:hypothetical protein DL762_010506 [Monosporascus cannonballus]RYO81578.1 hypothetical protein DL763_008529 [Monosporascus cannonballus]RYP36033.1 hypothetical protein DL766_002215 [Monosporascus sp. MC13-8B]
MATQQDLQELLRLLTVGRVPVKDAMTRVKALQSNHLKSIQQIAEAPLSAVEAAIQDSKAARTLHNACKARIKQTNNSGRGNPKRTAADESGSSTAKRFKISDTTAGLGGSEPPSPQDYEASLELPLETDEETINSTALLTNRAPLVLAFAVELLRYTMPEQPPSSRLSLAQAVVSANSRSKAVSIGLERGPSADEEGWGRGQPRVKIMGREVSVLKRSGYAWKGDEDAETSAADQKDTTAESMPSSVTKSGSDTRPQSWSASQPTTLKNSTFVVRATQIAQPSQRQSLLQSLFTAVPSLQTATHNAWAYRVRVPTNLFSATAVREEAFDDGESGAGDFLLKNMRELDAVDTLVVMTRWYGGIMLGPDRWRIMRNCMRDALSERLRLTGTQAGLGREPVWGLDLEAMRSGSTAASSAPRSYEPGVVGMPIHRPEAARAYLLKSFATRMDVDVNTKSESNDAKDTRAGGESLAPRRDGSSTPKTTAKKKTARAVDIQENAARVLGAIRLLYDSWAGHLSADELDRRAWGWYVAVRPEVQDGPSGWGAKGRLKLSDILNLRRKDG